MSNGSLGSASAAEAEGDSEGIFAVQLEVMGKLLDAERRKMALLQSELVQHTAAGSTSTTNTHHANGENSSEQQAASSGASTSGLATTNQQQQQQRIQPLPVSRTIQGEAISRQRQSITRLQEQHDRLETEYRVAAAGMFRKRSSASAPKAQRSQPAIGLRQTTKPRPSIFNSLPLGDGQTSDPESPSDDNVFTRARKESLAASFADIAGRGARLSFVVADSPSMIYKNGRLVSGTLESLIEHLVPTDKHYPDRTFLFAFLLCSRLYLHPHELMARVAKQFRNIVGPTSGGAGGSGRHSRHSSASEVDVDGGADNQHTQSSSSPTGNPPVPGSSVPLGLRPGVMETARNMVQFLSEWTESFAYDFRDEKMMKHLKEITQACASLSPAVRQSVGQVTSVLIKRLATLDKYEDMLSRADIAMSEKLTQVNRQVDIMEICPSARVLAQQLTHVELERLTHIGAEEFIQTFVSVESPCTTDGEMKLTRNLEAYVEWFNRLSYLIAMEICCSSKSRDKKKRVKVIDYFIDVANECFQLNNFNSLMAIIAGINMTPVTRLKKTWSKVNMVNNELLETYANPSGNFNNYRVALVEVMSVGQVQDESFCVIPFFSLLVKDIYFLNQGMKKQTAEQHVNFEKCWQLAKLVTQFMSWKQVACDYERSRSVLNYLMTTPLSSEDELFLASFDVEAPESAYEKDRCKALRAKHPDIADKSSPKKR
ncbi:ras-GEF domain-containing family member 1B-like [Sycon ciliatum]|uniref:ras-GEF domain-containing family member 1B-like n=1 Tax=Sycon ciliatum TaxID=27933 RepID=UPI0020ADCF50